MSEVSVVRSKFGEQKYKEINEQYPLIEGYLFQKLDEILVMASLNPTMNYKINVDKYYLISIVQITFFQGFTAEVLLDNYNRRIGLNFINEYNGKLNYSQYYNSTLQEKVYEALNVRPGNHNHTWCFDYDFKYNYKNCQRIIDILKLFLAIESPEEPIKTKTLKPRIIKW